MPQADGAERPDRLAGNEVETPLDQIQTIGDFVETCMDKRHIGMDERHIRMNGRHLGFKRTCAQPQLTQTAFDAVDARAKCTQVLENQIAQLGFHEEDAITRRRVGRRIGSLHHVGEHKALSSTATPR